MDLVIVTVIVLNALIPMVMMNGDILILKDTKLGWESNTLMNAIALVVRGGKTLQPGDIFERIISTKEASERVGIHQGHIRHLVAQGKIKGVKRGRDWFV